MPIAKPYAVAALQMCSGADLDANLEAAEALVGRAAARGASLVGLPENFPQIGLKQEEAVEAARRSHGPASWLLAGLARKHGITVFGGLLAPTSPGKAYNELHVYGPEGEMLGRYAKRHLFDVDVDAGNSYRESACIEAGEEVVVAELGALGRMGLSICYDLRFPEHYRSLMEGGAELLSCPAAFLTATGMDHWHVLLRARAIENTAYMVAPAQCGWHHPGRRSYGHALVVDPWGCVLADAGEEPGMALAEVDAERLKAARARIPCLQHIRS